LYLLLSYEPLSYMWSVVDRNVVMRRIPVFYVKGHRCVCSSAYTWCIQVL